MVLSFVALDVRISNEVKRKRRLATNTNEERGFIIVSDRVALFPNRAKAVNHTKVES